MEGYIEYLKYLDYLEYLCWHLRDIKEYARNLHYLILGLCVIVVLIFVILIVWSVWTFVNDPSRIKSKDVVVRKDTNWGGVRITGIKLKNRKMTSHYRKISYVAL